MKSLSWILCALGLLSIFMGVILVLLKASFYLTPEGYWRGAMAFWLLSINLHLLTGKNHPPEKPTKSA